MDQYMPYVSVIIPTYNRKNVLERAINSVLTQTFTDYELIVVDDGSDDGTLDLEIIKKRKSLIYYRFSLNNGVSRARNFGVNHSKGKWIAFLDSDDEWMPQKLEIQTKWIKKNPEYRIVQTNEIWIRNGKQVNPPRTHHKFQGNLFDASLQRCMITPSSVMIERELFNEVGGFNESIPACEDYDLWLRICCKESVGLVNEKLLKRYGGHPDQLSSSVMGLDRFRIRSLMGLLLDKSLSEQKRVMVSNMLEKKARIVANGYLKRGNIKLYERFISVTSFCNPV